MENEPQKEQGNSEFILPIQCPHCKKEIELAMGFSLLPPKTAEADIKKQYDELTGEEDK